jgi:hypothetical protein
MTEDLSNIEDLSLESLSALEALEDVAGIVEALVLSFGGERERDAYLAAADEFEAYVETLPEDDEKRTAEQTSRLSKLEEGITNALKPLLAASPEHIRNLHVAVQRALEAEEASGA